VTPTASPTHCLNASDQYHDVIEVTGTRMARLPSDIQAEFGKLDSLRDAARKEVEKHPFDWREDPSAYVEDLEVPPSPAPPKPALANEDRPYLQVMTFASSLLVLLFVILFLTVFKDLSCAPKEPGPHNVDTPKQTPSISSIAMDSRLYSSLLGVMVGAACVLAAQKIPNRVGPKIEAPTADHNPPDRILEQLQAMTDRTKHRLQMVHKCQLMMALVMFAVLMGLVVWTIVMVSRDQITYAVGFGSTSVAGLTLSAWKWQPFDRATKAQKIAVRMDALSLGLSQRMASIKEIQDPQKREKSQWKAVVEFSNRINDD
jgi:hypothetical protein